MEGNLKEHISKWMISMTDMKIKCKWLEEDEQILINPDGQVIPCCYLSPYFTTSLSHPLEYDQWVFDEFEDQLYHRDRAHAHVSSMHLYKEYQKVADELNIFKNDLEDILNHDWYTKILPESWTDESKVSTPCRRICGDGKRTEVEKRYR